MTGGDLQGGFSEGAFGRETGQESGLEGMEGNRGKRKGNMPPPQLLGKTQVTGELEGSPSLTKRHKGGR